MLSPATPGRSGEGRWCGRPGLQTPFWQLRSPWLWKGRWSPWASGPSFVNGDSTSFFAVLLAAFCRMSRLGTPHTSGAQQLVLLVAMMERLWNQGAGKSPRLTAASLDGAHQLGPWLPPAAPDQPLMSSAGAAARLYSMLLYWIL